MSIQNLFSSNDFDIQVKSITADQINLPGHPLAELKYAALNTQGVGSQLNQLVPGGGGFVQVRRAGIMNNAIANDITIENGTEMKLGKSGIYKVTGSVTLSAAADLEELEFAIDGQSATAPFLEVIGYSDLKATQPNRIQISFSGLFNALEDDVVSIKVQKLSAGDVTLYIHLMNYIVEKVA